MNERTRPRKGKYRGELRQRFNIIEQWDGKRWREPPEVGWSDADMWAGNRKINFDMEDCLHDKDDPVDRAFRPR